MACTGSFWLQWGTLCSLFAFLFAQDSPWDCAEKDDLLKDVAVDLDVPSECALGCTALTYRGVFESQKKLTLRFKDSYTGEPDEHCWSTKLKCSHDQRLQNAFILLPVDLSVVNGENLRLQVSSAEAAAEILQRHTGHSLLPSECGIRFDITEQLTSKERQPVLCVNVLPQGHAAVGGALRCPPFLVTTWKHWNQGEG